MNAGHRYVMGVQRIISLLEPHRVNRMHTNSSCPDLFRASFLPQPEKMAGTKPGHDELGRTYLNIRRYRAEDDELPSLWDPANYSTMKTCPVSAPSTLLA